MIVADRRKLLNGNSFRLGVSGSGKSFSAKEEIVSIALSTNDDILILDPESGIWVLGRSTWRGNYSDFRSFQHPPERP